MQRKDGNKDSIASTLIKERNYTVRTIAVENKQPSVSPGFVNCPSVKQAL